MARRLALKALVSAAVALALGCTREGPPLRHVDEIQIGGTLTLAERPFRVGGFPANQACVDGSYTHLYTISSGIRAGEVWLCCVPIAELLRDNFSCADGATVPIGRFNGGTADDLKVQYCALYDPESTERAFTPACLPAPLQAPI